MNKISKKMVPNGIYEKAPKVYVFAITKGSTATVYWRHHHQVSGVTQREAKRLFIAWYKQQLAEFEASRLKVEQSGPRTITFAEYTRRGDIPANDGPYLQQLKDEAKGLTGSLGRQRVSNLQTVEHMQSLVHVINRRAKAFAALPLDKITPKAIDDMLTSIKEGYGVSNNTLNHYLHTISKVYKLAQSAQLVPDGFNPTRKVAPRPLEYRKKTIITASQYQPVARAIMRLNPIPRAGLLLSLMCGLRREELLGLTWDDVDLTNASLTIQHTLISFKNDDGQRVRTLKTGTKNKTTRTIGLPDVVRDALQAYWNSLPNKDLRWTDEVSGTQYRMLWLYPNGCGLYCSDYFTHMWGLLRRKLIAQGVLTQTARFHDLRGGFITYLLNAKHVSAVVVAALAGHKSAKMTLDVYGEADEVDIKNATNILNDAIKATPNKD